MIQAELLQPLVQGETYYASMYVSMAYGRYYNMHLACDHMGMLLTQVVRQGGGADPEPLPNYAHVYATNVISDTANWTLISGSFVADSAYEYVVIGNHFDDAYTDTASLGTSTTPMSYYWVDQVCVSTSPTGCGFEGSSITENEDQALMLFPNPANAVLNIRFLGRTPRKLAIVDTMGRQVLLERFEPSKPVEVGFLCPGTYQVQLWDEENGIRTTQTFLKI